MSEEIFKIELSELLQTVRLKRANGTFLEASNIELIRDCCAELRDGRHGNAGDVLLQFFNLAAQITDKSFPVKVEFAVKTG